MNRNVVIIGNSGAARECYWLLREVMKKDDLELGFKGFLAFEGFKGDLGGMSGYSLGSDDDYVPAPGDVFIIGIGQPSLRLKAFYKWKARGASFMTLMHPNVVLVGDDVLLGEGNILTAGCYLSCNTSLGNANYLNGSIVVGHDVRVGDGNFFGPFSIVLGNARVGSGNSFGTHAVILPEASIGNNNMIAPGATLYKGCGDNRTMSGNPAQDLG
ncbi:hypothetical protein FACS1894205_1130 [Alphaproteobacteria bacterium]|nr:hypothetical protein FACS1894205_1130 [Alphaproteobacteria bacterium]